MGTLCPSPQHHARGLPAPGARPVEAARRGQGRQGRDNPVFGSLLRQVNNMTDNRLKNPKVRTAFGYEVRLRGQANMFLKGSFNVQQTFLPIGFPSEIKREPTRLVVAKAKELARRGKLKPTL